VTVALSGDGGDEAFGGYERYVAHGLAGRADRFLGPLRPALAALGGVLPQRGDPRGFRYRTRRFLEALATPPADRHARWMAHFNPEQKAALCTPEFAAAARDADSLALHLEAFTATDAEGAVEAAMAADVARYLPDDLLVKLDVATMAHGLEARCPFLDSDVLEFAARLPVRSKVHGRATKILLRRALRDLLPPEILRRPKQGFGVPLDGWLRGPLKELAFDMLLSPRAMARGLFRAAAVRQLVEDHVSGRADRHYQIWNLLMLELWYRAFIDHDGAGRRGVTG
jgi:asparagine synthase (glutamine-hydrolysing)